MSLALIGRKIGTTMSFSENGKKIVELTAIFVSPNFVSQIKREEKDGYNSIQIASEECKVSSLTNSQVSHLKKCGLKPMKMLAESRGIYNYSLGQKLGLEIFSENEKIKVTGKSKGKGFSGVIKRHHHSRGPMGHGSGYHRGVGSMGPIAPNRVAKGKKLPGRMGFEKRTVRNLLIYKILEEKNLIFIKGSIPGPVNGMVLISKIN